MRREARSGIGLPEKDGWGGILEIWGFFSWIGLVHFMLKTTLESDLLIGCKIVFNIWHIFIRDLSRLLN